MRLCSDGIGSDSRSPRAVRSGPWSGREGWLFSNAEIFTLREDEGREKEERSGRLEKRILVKDG